MASPTDAIEFRQLQLAVQSHKLWGLLNTTPLGNAREFRCKPRHCYLGIRWRLPADLLPDGSSARSESPGTFVTGPIATRCRLFADVSGSISVPSAKI